MLQLLFKETPSFLDDASDLNEFVEGGLVLNLANAGVDPTVLVNNNTYPLSISHLGETPDSISLDKYTTLPSVIYDHEKKQYSYDKAKGDLERHRNAIMDAFGLRGAYNFAPSSHTPGTPVLTTSGAANAAGRKIMKWNDLIDLGAAFDAANIPTNDRTIVLCSEHYADLQKEDLNLFKTLVKEGSGEVINNYGWKIRRYNLTPVYDSSSEIKSALGTAPVAINELHRSSVAFQKSCVGKADGLLKMFSTVDDPQYTGTIMNFEKHSIAVPRRAEGYGAIITAQ